jgi:hypothetical protein
LAARNPWAKRGAGMPQYEAPKRPVDPMARFAKAPNALARMESFRGRLKQQGRLLENGKIPSQYRKDLLAELADFEEAPREFDLQDEAHIIAYRRRASENGKLTIDEIVSLVDHTVDPAGYQETKDRAGVKDFDDIKKELRERGGIYGDAPGAFTLSPFLVNVTWTYEGGRGGGRKSPDVIYSIEGVFYGMDEEEVMVAGQDFINTYVRPAVFGGGNSVIDGAVDAPSGTATVKNVIESAGAEATDGAQITKDDARDRAFNPNVKAFFLRRNGKISLDENFKDPGYRYRITKEKYEAL